MRVLRQLIIRFMSSEDCCLLRSTEGSSLLGSNLITADVIQLLSARE